MPLVVDPETFFIGGVGISWNSLTLKVDAIPRRHFVSLDWEEALEREKISAAIKSGKPFAMTYGKYDMKSLSVGMLPQEKAWLRAYLATKAAPSISAGRAEFTLQVQLSEGLYSWTGTFIGCKLKSSKGSLKLGAEATETPVELDCRYMVETDINGPTTLYDDLRDVVPV